MTKKEAIELFVNRDLQAVPQGMALAYAEKSGEYPRFGMWGTVFLCDDLVSRKIKTRRMCESTEELGFCLDDYDEDERELLQKAIKEKDYSFLENYIDEDMGGEYCILNKEGETTAAYLHELSEFDCISVNGAGWNFYDGVWNEIYDALGLQWHDDENKSREVSIIVSGGVAYLEKCPTDVKVLCMDRDGGELEYHSMDITVK